MPDRKVAPGSALDWGRSAYPPPPLTVPVPPPPEELPLPCEGPPVPVGLGGVGREGPLVVPLLGAGWLGAETSVTGATGATGATLLGAGSTAAALGPEPVVPLLSTYAGCGAEGAWTGGGAVRGADRVT